MRVVIVGSGGIGRRHAGNVLALLPDADVLTVSRECPSWLLPSCRHFFTLHDALSQECDIVILANPCVFHLRDAHLCLDRGCHVLVEKPLAPHSEGIAALIQKAASVNKLLVVGYNLRHHACLEQLKRQLDNGVIGRLLTAILVTGQHLPDWRPAIDYRQSVSAQSALGGGVLLELSHEFDVCTWLAGQTVSITANTGRASTLAIDVEDYAQVMLRLAGGAAAMIHLDFMQRPGRRHYRLIGTEGVMEWASADPSIQVCHYKDASRSIIPCKEAEDPNHSYLAELQWFFDQMDSGAQAVPQATYDAAHVVRIVEACRVSATTGASVNV